MATDFRRHLTTYLSASWPAASLALSRFLFGLAMVISCVRFMALGWVHEQYVLPKVHFTYYGFHWVQPLGAAGMYAVFGVMTLAAVGVMLGCWYRISIVTFAVLFTYVELLDKTYYLNHYYFVSMMSLVLCLLPAHCTWSVDAMRKPSLQRAYVPRWMVDAVKLQIGVVYVFAGLAKITPDWLLHALPLSVWLPAHDTLPVIGPLMALPWTPYVFSWAGMIFDCTAPFFLLARRTRPYAYAAVVVFHTVTGLLFQIGVFPVVMILMTLVFFPPPRWALVRTEVPPSSSLPTFRILPRVLAAHFVIQLLLPLRFLLYPGPLFWTEEGYRFSWRVMLMEKSASATFFVRDPATGHEGAVVNGEFLNAHQEKQMAMQPDMILQFAHIVRDHYTAHGIRNPEVRAEVWATLNGRPSRPLVDSTVNLAAEHDGFGPYRWVTREP